MPLGTTFTILENTSGLGTTGFFEGLSEGSTFDVGDNRFQITYAGGTGANDVIITTVAVPEPASIGLLAIGAIGLLRRRRMV
jgi:hypothetical protein